MENIFTKIRDLELSLFNIDMQKSADEISTLFADDFTEFNNFGKIYYKPDAIDRHLSDTEKGDFKITNYSLKILSSTIIQTTFKKINVNDNTDISYICSSMWRKSDIGEWQMFFHQITNIY